jgi:hypothetical protein
LDVIGRDGTWWDVVGRGGTWWDLVGLGGTWLGRVGHSSSVKYGHYFTTDGKTAYIRPGRLGRACDLLTNNVYCGVSYIKNIANKYC